MGWKTVLQIARSQVVRCCEAVRGAMKTSLKHKGAHSSRHPAAAPGILLQLQLGQLTMWLEQPALPRRALGLFSEEKAQTF